MSAFVGPFFRIESSPLEDASLAADLNLHRQLENGDRYANNVNRPLIGSRGTTFERKCFLC
jgi:hypothetical protein